MLLLSLFLSAISFLFGLIGIVVVYPAIFNILFEFFSRFF